MYIKYGPLLSVDAQLRGLLQLPLLCVVFVLHDAGCVICGDLYTIRCGHNDARREVRDIAIIRLNFWLIFVVYYYLQCVSRNQPPQKWTFVTYYFIYAILLCSICIHPTEYTSKCPLCFGPTSSPTCALPLCRPLCMPLVWPWVR